MFNTMYDTIYDTIDCIDIINKQPIYNYNLEIASNDFHNPLISIPINLNINELPCNDAEIGDLNYDGQINVLDIIAIVNIIIQD